MLKNFCHIVNDNITYKFLNQARLWFLELTFVWLSACVCVCVCLPLRLLVTNHARLTSETSYTTFWFLYIAPTIDIANERRRSEEAHHELPSKKT